VAQRLVTAACSGLVELEVAEAQPVVAAVVVATTARAVGEPRVLKAVAVAVAAVS